MCIRDSTKISSNSAHVFSARAERKRERERERERERVCVCVCKTGNLAYSSHINGCIVVYKYQSVGVDFELRVSRMKHQNKLTKINNKYMFASV